MVKIGIGIKTVELSSGEKLHFWYANNAGNSGRNVTIIRSTDARASVSKKQTGIIRRVVGGHWAGNINFSKKIQAELGL